MPRNWLEELVLEWLQLKGYLSESNLPVSSPAAGGRREADVVGARVVDGVLDIVHVETGQLAGGQKSIESVKLKFSSAVVESVRRYFTARFSSLDSGRIVYQQMLVASF